jgi:hypothetical protein
MEWLSQQVQRASKKNTRRPASEKHHAFDANA